MTFSPPPLLRGWRAVVLLAAIALSDPGKASAGCGDYITYAKPHANQHHTTAGAGDASAPTPAGTPCRGPDCSGAPVRELPPVPPAPPGGVGAKEAAQRLGGSDDPDPGSQSALRGDGNSPRPIRRASSIFHPPRPV
ncbi:MAG TPA: hypothetical protein VM529_11520 [Gemmata sp.]|nr:hypothetical protein [Gemmata sp.]